MSKRLNTKGFSAVETLLVLILIAILGFTGFYVMNARKNTDKTLSETNKAASSTTSTTQPKHVPANPTANWKTYTSTGSLKYSFKYPTDWALASDGSKLTAPSGFTLSVSFTNTGHPSLDYKPTIRFTGAVAFNKTVGYLDYIGGTPIQDSDGLIYSANLSQTATDSLDTFQVSGFNALIIAQSKSPESVAAAKADADYATTAQVIKTFTF